ncbi:S41 family peptidase [Massilia sp. IC2-476]|uniref:S41 family peptidase n=1 Tax=Massilia sp. IC2-476 TaxID=2887199 RepID=UPI001D1128DA|nr:S41 family peptidase [Massilia sp. IC2-476]MCC2974848.1 hypothetical protein [Massilia sp. IC2-476]
MWRWVAAAVCMTGSLPAFGQTAQLTPQQWREDLKVMAETMPVRHRNLYHTMSREQFQAAVAALDAKLDSLPRHQVIVEMARIVGMVEDGHTNIAPTRDPKIGFRAFPIALYFFDDGLYVRAAHEQHRELVGAKLVGVGGKTVEQAYAALRQIVGRDNEQNALFFVPHLLVMPEVLHAFGLSDSPDRARLVIERDGKRSTVELTTPQPATMMPPDTDTSFMPRPGWVDARLTTPLWLQDADSKFRMEYLKPHKLLYVQLNQVGNEKEETLAQFAARIQQAAASQPVEKIVLDLRLNRGGNGMLAPPLIAALLRATPLEARRELFAIVGRSTFSAAQFVVNDLEHYTEAVLVGEPTGGRPNAHSDSRRITLPNSGITVRVSTLWWQEDERDRRPWTAPTVAAPLGFDAYRRGEDPALTAILAYRPAPPLADLLLAAPDALPTAYAGWRARPRNRYADVQMAFYRAGHALLAKGLPAEALVVFRMWEKEHPQAAYAWDGIGAAQLALGERVQAREAYRKALALDRSLASALAALEKL